MQTLVMLCLKTLLFIAVTKITCSYKCFWLYIHTRTCIHSLFLKCRSIIGSLDQGVHYSSDKVARLLGHVNSQACLVANTLMSIQLHTGTASGNSVCSHALLPNRDVHETSENLLSLSDSFCKQHSAKHCLLQWYLGERNKAHCLCKDKGISQVGVPTNLLVKLVSQTHSSNHPQTQHCNCVWADFVWSE